MDIPSSVGQSPQEVSIISVLSKGFVQSFGHKPISANPQWIAASFGPSRSGETDWKLLKILIRNVLRVFLLHTSDLNFCSFSLPAIFAVLALGRGQGGQWGVKSGTQSQLFRMSSCLCS